MSDPRWKSVAAEIMADMQPKPVAIPSKPALKLVPTGVLVTGILGMASYKLEGPGTGSVPETLSKKRRLNAIERPAARFVDIMTLHELLAWALADFEIVLADKRYKIHGEVLCEPEPFGTRTIVGFAGSVLVVNANDPTIKTKPFQRRVSAIQSICEGYFIDAYTSIAGPSERWSWYKEALLDRLDAEIGSLDIRANERMSRREARKCLPEIRKLYRDLKEANL